MTSAWIENGPVSVPSKPVTYTAGVVLAVIAVAGLGLGFKAAMRQPSETVGPGQKVAADGSIQAQPIVVLPPPVAAPQTQQAKTPTPTDQAKADAAARAAAAQQVQAKPANPNGDIDDILTSASEKPPAPVKPAADEAPPPPKSDVPF